MRRFWQAIGRARHRFRRWRRGRPFWGGVFLILGGLQLFLSGQLSLANMEISFGPEGFLQILLPLVLALCGLLVWATPQQRHFYGIIGTVTAVYSLLGLNLGGWFLGMLFGVIGGALAFAWTPVRRPAAEEPEPEPEPEPADERPTAELPEQRTAPEAEPEPADDRPIWDSQPADEPEQEPRRSLVLVAPVLLLVTTLAAPPVASQICLPPLINCPEETPSPTPGPDPEPDPDPIPIPIPIPTPTPTGPPGEPGEPSPTPTVSPSPIPTTEPPSGQPIVAAEPALLTADRLEQQAFRFEGITELPTATGTVRVLAFSFNRSVATNFSLTATVDDQDTTVTADPLTLAGDGDRVIFYTSRFRGNALGVLPLELTPDSPAVALLELVQVPLNVFFTDVNLDLVFTSGAVLTATGFRLTT
jgi:hypothetical protein